MFEKIKKKSDEPQDSGLGEMGASAPSAPNAEFLVPKPTVQPAPPATSASNTRVLQTPEKPSIISEPFTFRGDIEAEGTLHIEGTVMGSVTATNIHISTTGKVEGDVRCKYVSVKGHVGGTVVCEELVLSASAVIDGQVTYRYITVARGAQVLCDVHHKG